MATRGKGGGGKEREKKGNPSSSPQPKKPTPSKPSSSSTPTPSPSSSSSSQKPVPNYLKPTISSSNDSSLRTARRPTTDSSTAAKSLQKPLNASATAKQPSSTRRHAVDKPSTATRQPKNQPSIPTQRSLSTISAASVKAAAGPAMRRSVSVKASTSTSTSSIDTRKTERKKGVKSAHVQPQDADPLHHMGVGGGRENVASLADISEMVDQEEQLGDPAVVVDQVIDSKPKECQVKDDPAAMVVQQVIDDSESKECHVKDDPAMVVQSELKESQVEDEKIVEEEKGEGEAEEQDKQVIEAPAPEKEERTIVTEEKRESVERADDVDEAKGEEDQNTVKIEEKIVVVESEVEVSEQGGDEEAKAESSGKGGQPGKEAQQPYNDVIEETASKLMEDKRNKVRALAGAFETVISLQDTKPDSSK